MPSSRVRLGVEAGHAEDDAIAIEQDAHLGLLGGRRAVVGIALQEVGGRHRLLPGRLVRRAVDDDRFALGEPVGADLRGAQTGRGDRRRQSSNDDTEVQ